MTSNGPGSESIDGDFRKGVRIQLLHVTDCPLVDQVRTTLRKSLARIGSRARIEELEGPYPSPTLLINGVDVTGRTPAPEASCRLDLPTEEQILGALAAAGNRKPRPAVTMDPAQRAVAADQAPEGVQMGVMTIGRLSRRTGVSVKALREYEDVGLIYTVGRSPGNYRLFGEEALWCVGVVGTLRRLGLTLAEMREVAEIYLRDTGETVGPRLAGLLRAVRARTADQIADLQRRLEDIDDFEAHHATELAGPGDFRDQDPRRRTGLDSPPGGGRSVGPR